MIIVVISAKLSSVEMRLNVSESRVEELDRKNAGNLCVAVEQGL